MHSNPSGSEGGGRYVYPQFSTRGALGFRFGGPGLGNLLFPYTRAVILADRYNLKLINPTWPTIKIGTLLRFERDKRFYTGLFNAQGIHDFQKTRLLLTLPKLPERDFEQDPAAFKNGIVITSGLKNYFKDIAAGHELVKSSLLQSLPPHRGWMRLREGFNHAAIGIHVRAGDFSAAMREPIEWYVETLAKLRQATDASTPAILFSDGSDAELAPLLALPNVTRNRWNDALAEMLALGSCRVIIASHSTFSAWAAYLGHRPIIWGRPPAELEGIFTDEVFQGVVAAGGPLPPSLLSQLQA